MSASAFTAVSARRTFGGSDSFKPVTGVPTQTAQPSQPTKVDWPMAVREYVQRSFAAESNIAGVSVEDMQKKLKQVINAVAERGALYEVDWQTHPLPQQMLVDEKLAAAKVISPVAPWQNTLAEMKLHDEAAPRTNLVNPKKRKSFETANVQEAIVNSNQQRPWRQTSPPNVFENRITFPNLAPAKKSEKKRRALGEAFEKVPSKFEMGDLEKRRQRFEPDRPIKPSSPHDFPGHAIVMEGVEQGPVVGTCETLLKNYYRLTAPPKPEDVRPPYILTRTLELLKIKWKTDNNYAFICDQFKSMRQDLTVQHIKTGFTVEVYELHARIALEMNDLGEYNQCQTQLRAMYKQNLGGHPIEFLAYRVLYFIYTCNRADMNDLLANLTPTDRGEPALKHALSVRSALASGNYHRFFRLFQETPNMGAYLIDMFTARERLAALSALCKTYKPTVPLRFVTEELGFESDEECAAFICAAKGDNLLEKVSGGVTFATGKAGMLFEQRKAAAFKKVDIKGQI